MIAAILLAFWSHWRRNRLQLATLITGIALATALWTGVQAINAEARASMTSAASASRIVGLPRLEPVEGETLTWKDFVALRRAGVLVSPIIRGDYRLQSGEHLRLTGIDPLSAPSDLWPGGDFMGSAGAADSVFVPANTAPESDLVADPSVPNGQAVADIQIAQRLLGRTDLDALLLLSPQPLGAPDPLGVTPHLAYVLPAETAVPAALTDSFRLNLSAFGALCFIVGLFIVRGTVGLAIAQRRQSIRTLRTLGAPAGLLRALMLAEIAIIATLSGLLGVLLGYGLASWLMPGVSVTLDGIYGASVGTHIALRPVWWLGGLAMAVLGTLLSAAGPMLAASDRAVLNEKPRSFGYWWPAAGLALFAAAAGLVIWGHGLLAAFAAIAALLLGGAATMPATIRALLRAARPLATGPLGEWMLAETETQIPRMSLAMTALMMALAANIGVSTMVGSFRESFAEFIDQRLAAEIYVATPGGAGDIRAELSPDERLLPLRSLKSVVAGQPAEINGVINDPTYREWSLLEAVDDPWSTLSGDGAIISEQLSYRAALSIGDVIALPDGPATVSGIIADYGNPLGKVYVSHQRLDRIAPGLPTPRHAIRTSDPASLRARMIAAGIPAERIAMQADMKATSMRIFERTFAVTAALNGLTLAVAGFAVLTSLLAAADARLPRLTPLWAMGIERRQLARLELLRVALTAAATALLALPLGILLSWLLLAIVNVEAFGWRLPFRADPAHWLLLIGVGIAASVLSALWPAHRLARISSRALSEVLSRDG
ncbi:ABC transporter permease [Paracoccus aurantiacus]|uniref:ABC transporter permease n=1 Tax=Paracoccus aurantiacus TaxID=2599412 RepID=A0A5C6S2E7_9RHOB|nr:FtsX-like permease family protein [Paracoccus aurantiacus]TXB68779.1 ABC transporter permease [Paracoccus aurantiacus]